jgi:hypothetical protein
LEDHVAEAFVQRSGIRLDSVSLVGSLQSKPLATNSRIKKDTSLSVNIPGGPNKDPLTFGGRKPIKEDYIVLMLPAFLTGLAFELYDETNYVFHAFVEFASSNTWKAVDGGTYLSDLLAPALNGPVSTFVALLFGSLTSMTMSTLYNRQATLAREFASIVEDVRLSDIHFSYFPADYDVKAKSLLKQYVDELLYSFEEELVVEEMQRQREIRAMTVEKLISVLHELSRDPDVKFGGPILDEAYGAVNRIIRSRVNMVAVYDQQFP